MNSLKDAVAILAEQGALYAVHIRDHVDLEAKAIKKLDGNCEFCMSHVKGAV